MVKFKDFSRTLSVSSTFQGKFNFQGLFKKVLYIQVLFKPVGTLAILSTFIKLPFVFKTFVLSILSGCLRQVLLYSIPCFENSVDPYQLASDETS